MISIDRKKLVGPVAAMVLTAAGLAHSASAESAAATQPARSPRALADQYQQDIPPLQKALARRDFASADDRKAMTPDAVPALRAMIGTLVEMQSVMPEKAIKIQNQVESYRALLYALEDRSTIQEIDVSAKALDLPDGRAARIVQLRSDWIKTGAKDSAGRGAVVGKLQKLDEAHPDDPLLTITTFTFYQQTTEPTQKAQLQAMVTDVMKNPLAAQFTSYFNTLAARQQQIESAADKLKGLEGKPLGVAGNTVEGLAFSTAKWKGKVVLVDFWATWCVPCRAELPRVKQMYDQYHDKGLEVLGVSNDYDPAPLKAYDVSNKLPWPELFDPSAAAQQQFNPVTLNYGIEAIPRMFLIDKSGVLRTTEARESMESLIPKLLAE